MSVASVTPAPDLSNPDPSPFHRGEQQVQTLAGARSISEQLGRSWHRKQISPASAAFLAGQQLLYTATRSLDDRLWATVLVGPEGFAATQNPLTLCIQPLRQFKGDAAQFNEGDIVGTTAIVLETRQRERLNGHIESTANGALTISVKQSFGSCPKYIQARKVEVRDSELEKVGKMGYVQLGDDELETEQRNQIERADTFFLATCYLGDLDSGDGVQGADVSHRGGPPGFLKVSGRGTVTFADYVGNYTFTTLGNLVLEPRAALLFVDYATGDTLQLSGKCQILWEDRQLPGAQRTMQFVTEKWVQVRGALPLQAPGKVRWSPYNPLPTCQYSRGVGEDRLKQLFSDYISTDGSFQMLRCLSKTQETIDVMTFEFEARKSKTLPTENVWCDPGQFASFDFAEVKAGETLNRTWTISSPQAHIRDQSAFTITVKKVGLVSDWLFKNMQPGRTICCRGVDGDFTLSQFRENPPPEFLFVAGGIGITPLRVMFHECLEKRIPATLLYSVRKQQDAVFWEEMKQAAEAAENAQVFLTITGKAENFNAEENGTSSPILHGHVDAAKLKQVCSNLKQRTVMQCGPATMMDAVSKALASLEFPLENLHQEAFFF